MSKFKMKLKLTGLEIEIEGSRDDVPILTQNMAAQLASQITPAANIAAARLPSALQRPAIEGQATPASDRTTRRKSRKGTSTTNGSGGESAVITWTHDPNTWGNPIQTWKGTDKGIWLLYIAKQMNAATEMTASQIEATFDRLFRSAKAPSRPNLIRDFGKLASQPPAKVSPNGTQDPPTWFLTDAGIRHAEGLVKEARGEATPAE